MIAPFINPWASIMPMVARESNKEEIHLSNSEVAVRWLCLQNESQTLRMDITEEDLRPHIPQDMSKDSFLDYKGDKWRLHMRWMQWKDGTRFLFETFGVDL